MTGVATIGDETFLVCRDCSVVFVYAVATMEFFRQFEIRTLHDAFDVVSCPRTKCLYIVDEKTSAQSHEILKVDTNGKVILKWSIGASCGTLCVTHESNLVLTDKVEGKLKEFSAAGKLLLEVALHKDIGRYGLSHAVKLTNGHFVVCHGNYEDLKHRICLMDNKGVVLKTVGEDPKEFNWTYPLYLAVDSDESIFVADNGNLRGLLFNSNLEFQRELLIEKDGLQDPWLSLDKSNGRLFVMDEGWYNTLRHDCRLLVFEVKVNCLQKDEVKANKQVEADDSKNYT